MQTLGAASCPSALRLPFPTGAPRERDADGGGVVRGDALPIHVSGAKSPLEALPLAGLRYRPPGAVYPPFRAAERHRRVGALAPGLRVLGE